MSELPVFGPNGVQNVHDDAPGEPRVIVRIDFQVSYNELIIAFLVGFTQLYPDRDPDGMSAVEVRQVVEGYLASASVLELARAVERLHIGDFTRQQYERLPALVRAVEDAYPGPEST
jgi:hypothetical protein